MTATLDATAPALAAAPAPAAVMQLVPGGMWKARVEQLSLLTVVLVPLGAVAAAVPLAWGRYVHLHDLLLAAALYLLTVHGITVGFHRHFTHGSFKARRWVRVTLAVVGSMAIEGPVKRWVADHRRHHAFSDGEGDPHSPHRYGAGFWPMAKGLFHAHVGWLFDAEQTNQQRFIPDLLQDKAIRVVDRLFAPIAVVSLGLPAFAGWLLTGTVAGTLQAFFWGGLVRVFLTHHVTWSVNSICHTWGSRPFRSRDQARNVWALAVLSCGESWHNLHHSDPTSARHGVLRGQLDSSARLIRWMEQLRLVHDVRWPSLERVAARRVSMA